MIRVPILTSLSTTKKGHMKYFKAAGSHVRSCFCPRLHVKTTLTFSRHAGYTEIKTTIHEGFASPKSRGREKKAALQRSWGDKKQLRNTEKDVKR